MQRESEVSSMIEKEVRTCSRRGSGRIGGETEDRSLLLAKSRALHWCRSGPAESKGKNDASVMGPHAFQGECDLLGTSSSLARGKPGTGRALVARRRGGVPPVEVASTYWASGRWLVNDAQQRLDGSTAPCRRRG